MNLNKTYGQTGFTLIEAIISIGVLAAVFSLSLPWQSDWRGRLELGAAAEEIISAADLARTRAVNGYGNVPHGLYLLAGEPAGAKIIIYQGFSYAEREAVFDEEIVLARAVTLATDIAGGDINFSRGFGRADKTGRIFLSGRTGNETIGINSYGLAEYAE